MRNCLVAGNDVGIKDGRSDNVTLIGNTVANNREAQILFTGAPVGREIEEFDTKKKHFSKLLNYRMEKNVLTATGDDFLIEIAGHLQPASWEEARKTMTLIDNIYTAGLATPFDSRGKRMSYADWINAVNDKGGTFMQKKQ